ncbi:Heat induced stress protein YflT [Lysinibacillus sp. 2017]|uniref:general stress protein n=1 Tax=unclassified Lysinibacillus TaxID=2636778 RepID=UPI000D52A5FA|nr:MULTISPECIES: general stress protein [unclassified Lysinibacillus]AWE06869.1 Heat induced stress protein YflT [Lysinibacillus sp. 2017]TGN37200.1 Heat induced stress protein YflT [Lysinibacillus sp. S2017]
MHTVENSVQAKSVIENFISEGYIKDHIHVFANSNKRAEGIANFFDVDAGATAETSNESKGFFESIKNFFQPSPEDFVNQLSVLGLDASEQSLAKNALDEGKLVIIAHRPTEEF